MSHTRFVWEQNMAFFPFHRCACVALPILNLSNPPLNHTYSSVLNNVIEKFASRILNDHVYRGWRGNDFVPRSMKDGATRPKGWWLLVMTRERMEARILFPSPPSHPILYCYGVDTLFFFCVPSIEALMGSSIRCWCNCRLSFSLHRSILARCAHAVLI